MSGFGFSAGDIVLGIKVLAKVGKAFHSTSGAAAKYSEAVGLLRSLKSTLDAITAYSQDNGDDFYASNITEQLQHIKPPWEAFNDFLTRFESLADKDTDHGALRKTRRTIEYALRDLNGEIDRLKLAITQPLQVIQLFLTLQATQTIPPENRRRTNSLAQFETGESMMSPVPNALQSELDNIQSIQMTQMARLVSAGQDMAMRTDRRPSIDTTPSLVGSSLGTEVSSIFSAREESIHTMTDDMSVMESSDKVSAASPTATQSAQGRHHACFTVHGYRRLDSTEQQRFLVPGRLFLTMQLVPTSATSHISSSLDTGGHNMSSLINSGIFRFLVIRNEGSCSLCVKVQRVSTRHNSALDELGPYEVPLTTKPHTLDDLDVDSMTLRMREAGEGSTSQLPPHSFVKLRESCLVQNNVKLMNMGVLTGDDRALLLALWQDANEMFPSS